MDCLILSKKTMLPLEYKKGVRGWREPLGGGGWSHLQSWGDPVSLWKIYFWTDTLVNLIYQKAYLDFVYAACGIQ